MLRDPTRRRLLGLAAMAGMALALRPAPLRAATETDALRRALAAAARGRWPDALSEGAAAGPLGQDVIRWLWLRDGGGNLGDYEDFIARRPDWPGMPWLRMKGEAAVARSQTPARIVAYFDAHTPRTAEGAARLVWALRAEGQTTRAAEAAAEAWRTLPFDPEAEAALLALEGGSLGAHHAARADHLLWEDRGDEAARMVERLEPGWRRLAAARLALNRDEGAVGALVDAVPAPLAGDPGLAAARFGWRLRRERLGDAASLIIERSATREGLGRPDAWAAGRLRLARALMSRGRDAEAYRVATGHQLTSGSDFAALEFLAGFLALRRLGEPSRAAAHFATLGGGVETAISVSRALYWQGRAAAAAGDGAGAEAALRAAAAHQTAFYGQLAAEELGLPLDPALATPDPGPDPAGAAFLRDDVMRTALMLRAAGDPVLGRRFALHLGESLGPEDMGRLGRFALEQGWTNLAVHVGKAAAGRGFILPDPYFPLSDMVPGDLPVARALALAITRRESEFDPGAISPAGARGLMQVMPRTGAEMARKLGLRFDEGRLISDPALNVRLGSAYLAQLIESYGPALALICAGYNAGPSRADAWIGSLGDPRDPRVDIVDWIESVPFTETRTYIMRVAESRVIYGARLAGASGPIRLRELLTGRRG
ncbi:MAG: transglycosylase SLT domain-containing protein [Gemmobacter sp.]